MNNSDMPAMPQSVAYSSSGDLTASFDFDGGQGLTKREHFAGEIMANLTHGGTDGMRPQHLDHVAEFSVKAADALLAALEKQ